MAPLAATFALAAMLSYAPEVTPGDPAPPPSSAVTAADTSASSAPISAVDGIAASSAPRLARGPRPPLPWLRAHRLERKQLRGARTLVAVGGVLFSVFYLGSTLGAATDLDALHEDGQIDPSERDQRRVARLMFVPIVGPLVAAPLGPSKGDKAALAGFGLMQGLAAAALVGGGVALGRDRRARRLALSAGWGPHGGSVGLRGRF